MDFRRRRLCIGNGRTTSYQYPAGGTYSVTLRVTDNVNQTSILEPDGDGRGAAAAARCTSVISTAASTATQKSWNANVTIEVHTENHGRAGGVTVTGLWDDGSTGTCTTDGSGRCAVSRGAIPRKMSSVSFTVTGATHSSFVFSPGANHDPDRDSNGTTIVIRRQ